MASDEGQRAAYAQNKPNEPKIVASKEDSEDSSVSLSKKGQTTPVKTVMLFDEGQKEPKEHNKTVEPKTISLAA